MNGTAEHELLLAEHELLLAERNAALREAFVRLPPGCQRLIAMLIQDPPVPYAKISAELGIPVGSIGPTRRRCLEKLRRDLAVAALIDAEAGLGTAATERPVALASLLGLVALCRLYGAAAA